METSGKRQQEQTYLPKLSTLLGAISLDLPMNPKYDSFQSLVNYFATTDILTGSSTALFRPDRFWRICLVS